jgi:hypothetical protein
VRIKGRCQHMCSTARSILCQHVLLQRNPESLEIVRRQCLLLAHHAAAAHRAPRDVETCANKDGAMLIASRRHAAGCCVPLPAAVAMAGKAIRISKRCA